MAKKTRTKADPRVGKAIEALQTQAAEARKKAEDLLKKAIEFQKKVDAVKPDDPSVDVEMAKLQRMIQKRSQMFDMLRQIIDKYNDTAKGVIQSIGR